MTTNIANELTMSRITKSFSGNKALQEVDFTVRSGEIHALLGANGAGKSTLMKILSGAYTKDAGEITINGIDTAIATPNDAIAGGIQCVYQEVDTVLVPSLTVAENVLLDEAAQGSGWVNWKGIYKKAEQLLGELGVKLNPRSLVQELSISQKQQIILARALSQKAKYIIFDEPTAPLSLEETDRLFTIIRKLRDEGIGCIFISHRLPEIFALCDRITVLRDGQHVLTTETSQTDTAQVIQAMLGAKFEEEFPKIEVPIGGELLKVSGATRGIKVKDVSLSVKSGEIVGIVGLVGAGKTELARVLYGADKLDSGVISLKGQKVRLREPADAVKAGIVLVPEERRKQGIYVKETVRANLALPSLRSLSSFGFIKRKAETQLGERIVSRLGVKPANIDIVSEYLSGGNQQKVAIGKWIPTGADVFLFDEPTKGVDIGAKNEIFKLIGELAGQGKGILYFSNEISEILGISDRILIMSYGRIVKELARNEATQERILYYASEGEA